MTTSNQFDNVSNYSDVLSSAAADFGSLSGIDLGSSNTTSSYTFTENYAAVANTIDGSNAQGIENNLVGTNKNNDMITYLFQYYNTAINENAATANTNPPYVVNENNALNSGNYTQIAQWFSDVTGGLDIGTMNLPQIINTLISNGFLQVTSPHTTASQGQFDSLVNSFLSTTNTQSLTTASEYGTAFINYLSANLNNQQSAITFELSTSNPPTSLSFPSVFSQSYLNSTLTSLANNGAISSYVANFAAILSNTSSSYDPLNLFDDINTDSALSNADQMDLFTGSIGTFLQSIDPNNADSLTNPQSPNYQPSAVTADPYTEWEQGAVAYAMTYLTSGVPSASYDNDTVLGLYQTIWDSYNPNNPQGFINNLLYFIKQQQATSGGFNPIGYATAGVLSTNNEGIQVPSQTPSGSLAAWTSQLAASNGGLTQTDPLSEGGYQQVQIVLTIYNQLLNLLNDIQIMTGSQLNRQTFYQEYQNAYTTIETRIPTVTGNGVYVGTFGGRPLVVLSGYGSANGVNATAIQQQSDISQLQTQFTESVKSFRSEVEDMSNAQNTAVNQSQEAVTQQLNVAQTLIQQFSTILQSIWR